MSQDRHSPLFLGIDFGTSGCRAIAIDDDDNIRAMARVDLPSPIVTGRRVAQDPTIWEQGLLELFKLVADQILLNNVVSICVDATSGSVLLAHEDGEAVGSALMYNDADNQQHAEEISRIAPLQSGAHGNSSGLAKLMTLANQYQGKLQALTQTDWIRGRMSGDYCCSDENNALKLGYDPMDGRWPEWLNKLIETDRIIFPRVDIPGRPTSSISPSFAKKTGLGPETRTILGTTDSIAAFIATGVSEIGEAVTTLGSTLVTKILSDKPVFDPAYGVYSHKLGNRWLVGGASNAGCAILKRYFTQQQLDQMTASLNPDKSTQLNYYPLLQKGERFPYADPEKEAVLTPRPPQDELFFQAILEGLTDIEKTCYERLRQCGAPYPTRVLSAGGGSINEPWRQMRENALGIKVERATQSEAAYGSALLAKQGMEHVIK